jgi:hypothetical protein
VATTLRRFIPLGDGRIALTDDTFIDLVGTVPLFHAVTPGVETIETVQERTRAQSAPAFPAEVARASTPTPIPRRSRCQRRGRSMPGRWRATATWARCVAAS